MPMINGFMRESSPTSDHSVNGDREGIVAEPRTEGPEFGNSEHTPSGAELPLVSRPTIMSHSLRAFVNARAVDVAPGATALDAIRAWSAEAADEVTAGQRIILDSRGLPIDGTVAVHAGAIYRLIPRRGESIQGQVD